MRGLDAPYLVYEGLGIHLLCAACRGVEHNDLRFPLTNRSRMRATAQIHQLVDFSC